MKQVTQDMIKVEKVINSCKTEEQLYVCKSLIQNFQIKYNEGAEDPFDGHLHLVQRVHVLINILNNKRKELKK